MKVRLKFVFVVLVLVFAVSTPVYAGVQAECDMWNADCMAACGPGPSACRGVCHSEYMECMDSTLCWWFPPFGCGFPFN